MERSARVTRNRCPTYKPNHDRNVRTNDPWKRQTKRKLKPASPRPRASKRAKVDFAKGTRMGNPRQKVAANGRSSKQAVVPKKKLPPDGVCLVNGFNTPEDKAYPPVTASSSTSDILEATSALSTVTTIQNGMSGPSGDIRLTVGNLNPKPNPLRLKISMVGLGERCTRSSKKRLATWKVVVKEETVEPEETTESKHPIARGIDEKPLGLGRESFKIENPLKEEVDEIKESLSEDAVVVAKDRLMCENIGTDDVLIKERLENGEDFNTQDGAVTGESCMTKENCQVAGCTVLGERSLTEEDYQIGECVIAENSCAPNQGGEIVACAGKPLILELADKIGNCNLTGTTVETDAAQEATILKVDLPNCVKSVPNVSHSNLDPEHERFYSLEELTKKVRIHPKLIELYGGTAAVEEYLNRKLNRGNFPTTL